MQSIKIRVLAFIVCWFLSIYCSSLCRLTWLFIHLFSLMMREWPEPLNRSASESPALTQLCGEYKQTGILRSHRETLLVVYSSLNHPTLLSVFILRRSSLHCPFDFDHPWLEISKKDMSCILYLFLPSVHQSAACWRESQRARETVWDDDLQRSSGSERQDWCKECKP